MSFTESEMKKARDLEVITSDIVSENLMMEQKRLQDKNANGSKDFPYIVPDSVTENLASLRVSEQKDKKKAKSESSTDSDSKSATKADEKGDATLSQPQIEAMARRRRSLPNIDAQMPPCIPNVNVIAPIKEEETKCQGDNAPEVSSVDPDEPAESGLRKALGETVNEESAAQQAAAKNELWEKVLDIPISRPLAQIFKYNVMPKDPTIGHELDKVKIKAQYKVNNQHSRLGPICFITPELGKWSTVGGLGVMVDELTQLLADFGEDVIVITPYYNRNRKGETDYLHRDGIQWSSNVNTWIGEEMAECGVHEGRIKGVRLFFIHNHWYFPYPYATGTKAMSLKRMVLMARASLQMLCDRKIIPAVIVTNDWFSGLVAPYAREQFYGPTFDNTTFYHLIHNGEMHYEGRIYIDPKADTYPYVHQLNPFYLINHAWKDIIINPTRAALLASNNWGTVSPSYRFDLMHNSSLGDLLFKFWHPYAFPNGIPVHLREQQVFAVCGGDHAKAKAMLQQKYFNGRVDPNIPLFVFVGRITEQKGIQLITWSVRELVHYFAGNIQIMVGGMANMSDPYSSARANEIMDLRYHMPHCFWGNPHEFFTDGALVNCGADFGLMPSLFEPGGIVQHEFFGAGTPVIAFKTGGLKDTVCEYIWDTKTGNGYTFEGYNSGDFMWAVHRAYGTFKNAEHYAQLRKNAKDSVIDGSTVAWAWLGEFYRMRGREAEFAERVSTTVIP